MTDSKKVMVFIDGSNFYYSLKKSFLKTKIDLKLFLNFLVKDDDLVQIFYYNAPLNQKDDVEEYKKQQKFFEYLRTIPKLNIFLGRLEKRADGHKNEKGVDVKLAIDLLINAYNNNFDIAILISNDSDFIPAIKEVQKLNKKIYNVSFKKTKSYHLNKVCNYTIKIDNIDKFI